MTINNIDSFINSINSIQSDEYSEIYEEKESMHMNDKMMNYVETLYHQLLEKNRYGSDYQFDDSWPDDLHEFVPIDNRIIKIITHLENSDYTSALLYVQDMLDSDQMQQLENLESERVARLSSETVGNM
jgi:hypothetical protein